MEEKTEGASAASATKGTEEKSEWVKRFNESGLSLRKFSAQHGLAPMSLWRWIHKRQESRRPEGDPLVNCAAVGFTEIKLPAPMAGSNWAAEVSLPNGTVVRVAQHVPAAVLEQLLRLC
jgi:hypothetical protein